MNKLQKLQKALIDPEYRISLLKNGDPELDPVIKDAHKVIEELFEKALADIGVEYAAALHDKKANHQNCSE